MLNKTHLVITIFFILVFLPLVTYKTSFVIVALIATLIPDFDSKFSSTGKHFLLRPFQFFLKHRDILHSFSFAILLTLFFVLFFPIFSFGFFVGYVSHLIADSFTIWGIKPFYPSKKIVSGKIQTGGKLESVLFGTFVIVDLSLLVAYLMKMF